jgi:hypothetical protein
MYYCTVTEVFLNLTEVFLTLTEVFPCFCKANARVKLAKTGHGPHSTTSVVFVLFACYLCCSMYCLCVNVHCHRVTTQLQLINISKRKERNRSILEYNFAVSYNYVRCLMITFRNLCALKG